MPAGERAGELVGGRTKPDYGGESKDSRKKKREERRDRSLASWGSSTSLTFVLRPGPGPGSGTCGPEMKCVGLRAAGVCVYGLLLATVMAGGIRGSEASPQSLEAAAGIEVRLAAMEAAVSELVRQTWRLELSRPQSGKRKREQQRFRDLLQERSFALSSSFQERALILAMVSHTAVIGDGGFNFAQTWLRQWDCSLKLPSVNLSQNYVLLAMDKMSKQYANRRGFPAVFGPDVLQLLTLDEAVPRTWVDYTLSKPLFVLEALLLGYAVMWSDLDVIFARNPFSLAFDENYSSRFDAQFALEDPAGSGIFFVRPTNTSINFVKQWAVNCLEAISRRDNSFHDQDILNRLLFSQDQLRYRIIDGDIFSNGCQVKDTNASIEMGPRRVAIHLNCMWGVVEKADFAQRTGLWLLNAHNECKRDPEWSP